MTDQPELNITLDARALYHRREQAGLTVGEMAERCGVTPLQVTWYEKGWDDAPDEVLAQYRVLGSLGKDAQRGG